MQFDTKYVQLDTRYLQLDTKYLQLDTKYLQLKTYFSIQIQNICNGKSIFQSRYKKLQTCCRNVGFCKKYTKKLQTFYKICVETQKINMSILSAILLQKHCISIKKICICKDFCHSVYKCKQIGAEREIQTA